MTRPRAGACSVPRRGCFARTELNATGIDAIINEAGTAKTTLYKLFGSKTNLVHVVLETEGKQWREWFIDAIESGGGSAQTKLARIFPALKDWFRQERFYGCPFINAVGEHDKDQKQLRAIAMRHKKVVLSYIEGLAGEMGGGGTDGACPSARASDGRRHRCSHGDPRSRGRRHRGPCRRFPVRTFKTEEAEASGERPGAADGRLIGHFAFLSLRLRCGHFRRPTFGSRKRLVPRRFRLSSGRTWKRRFSCKERLALRPAQWPLDRHINGRFSTTVIARSYILSKHKRRRS